MGAGFALRLKARARELGLTDAAVARRVGISERRYGHYAKGDREPNLDLLVRIAAALETTPDILLGVVGDDAPAAAPATDPDLAELGGRIHRARTRHRLYRLGHSFAAAVRIDEGRLRQIEDGLVEPSFVEVVRIARALDLALNELV